MKWITSTLGGDPSKIPPFGPSDEDCLYLNVWTPSLQSESRLPVLVWIHGGGFLVGTGSTPWYDGRSLAEQGAVVVTLNYRLGTLGFMAHPELTEESPHGASGNYGLLDQIAALEWVQRNIGFLGGDPKRVTVLGESSGGTSILLLMASPIAKGLFHRAVVQSAADPYIYANKPHSAAFSGRLDLAEAEKTGVSFAGRLGFGASNQVLQNLRSVPAEEIVGALTENMNSTPFVPNVDGWLLPESPAKVFRERRHQDLPLLIGVTANEGSVLLFDPDWTSVTDYRNFIQTEFGGKADRLLAYYSPSNASGIRSIRLRWYQAGCLAGSRYLAGSMEKLESPAYLYVFSRVPPPPGGEALGAFHFSEVQFVFNTHLPEVWPVGPGDENLTRTVNRFWLQFADTGDPNGPGLPEWSPFDRQSQRYMDLDHESAERSISVDEAAVLDVLESLFWR